jgi:hypothetical protein
MCEGLRADVAQVLVLAFGLEGGCGGNQVFRLDPGRILSQGAAPAAARLDPGEYSRGVLRCDEPLGWVLGRAQSQPACHGRHG